MWFQILCVNRGPVVHNGIVWTTTTMRQQGGTMPHAPSTARKRVLYYDVLNVVACFGVVAMHFNGLVYAYSPTFDWFQALFVDCFFYWAVPVFFMLTGATLLGYRDKYDTKTFFSKRLRRVAVPFLAWSLIALVWKVATGQMEPPVGPRSLIDLVFNTKIIDVYWFFIPLLAIYLCLPALTELREKRATLWYLAIAASIFNVALPTLFEWAGIEYNANAFLPIASGFLTYVLLGYLLKDARISKRRRAAIYAAGIAAFLVRYLVTIALSLRDGELNMLFWGYTYNNPTAYLEALAVFVFARHVSWERLLRTESARRRLASVAGCSFGIYLTHMFVFWYGLLLTGLQGADLAWRTAGPVVTYALCLAIVTCAKRVPGLRALFP